MTLAKDGEGPSRGANKEPPQTTSPPPQEASRGAFKGQIYLRLSPISGSVFALLLLWQHPNSGFFLTNKQISHARPQARTCQGIPTSIFFTVSNHTQPSLTHVTQPSLTHALSCPSELTQNKVHIYSVLTTCQEPC